MTPTSQRREAELEQVDRQQQAHVAVAEGAQPLGDEHAPDHAARSSRGAVGEVVERGDAVGLGPDADRARRPRCARRPARCAPRRRGSRGCACPRTPRAACATRCRGTGASTYLIVLRAAALGVVERDVVLERVGARDVVVVAVLPAPHDAARLVLAPGDRLELHLDEAVGERRALQHAPREGAAARLLEHVGRARRGGVGLDGPARRAVAGDARSPAGGQRARAHSNRN